MLAEAFVCTLLMTLLGVSTSYFIQHLVDSVLVRHEERLLNALGIGMVLILLFRTLLGLLRQYLMAHVSRKVDLTLMAGYARHLLGLPLQFFEMRQVGEILSRVNDAAKIREAVSGTTLTAVVDGTLVVLLVVVLWLYDMPLALVATAFVPLLLLSAVLHHPVARRTSRTAMEHAAHLSAHLVEDVSGVETIKAFGAEPLRAEEGETRLVRLVQSLFALQKLGISMNALGTFVTALAGLMVLWYGGHRVITGALTIGQLLFFYSLLAYVLEPLQRLASVNMQLQDALVAIDRLYQILDLEGEPLRTHQQATFQTLRTGPGAARRELSLWLPGARPGARHALHPSGEDRGDCRRKWFGQIDTPQAPDGVLHAHYGTYPARWSGDAGLCPGVMAPPRRPGVPGAVHF